MTIQEPPRRFNTGDFTRAQDVAKWGEWDSFKRIESPEPDPEREAYTEVLDWGKVLGLSRFDRWLARLMGHPLTQEITRYPIRRKVLMTRREDGRTWAMWAWEYLDA